MKRACFFVLLMAGCSLRSLADVPVDDPDINDYGFGQVLKHTQTDTGTVALAANPYSFQVFVGGNGGNITNATLAVPGPNAATYNIAGNADFKFGTSYQYSGTSSSTLLDSVFPRSTAVYTMNFTTPAMPTGYTVNSLNLNGGQFPSVTPEITGGGTWSNGVLLVDVTDANNYITVNSFTGMNQGTDRIVLDVWSTSDFHASTSGSKYDGSNFYLGPTAGVPYFTLGDTYQASITFYSVVYQDSVSVPTDGTQDNMGFSFMASRTYFTIQAIPEPSTYALMAGGLGLLGLSWLRRLKR